MPDLLRRSVLMFLAIGLASIAIAHAGSLEDAARASGKPLIVRFGLDRCLQCIKQGQAFETLEPKYDGKMMFRFVHIGENGAMAGTYKVLLIPTVLFFDAEGREVFRHVGYLDAGQLEAEMTRAGLVAPAGKGAR